MATITGMVVEKWTRRPVSGVRISVGHYVGVTDAMGRFNIEAPTGNYQVSISKAGFHPTIMPLNLLGATNVGSISIESQVVAL
ncbi:hypothetical protein LCGC14_2587050 [marine sediment metagenome]|uniref:PEGA domain-containing protein n=1 Tax=marine sediment metagenome TaxID=412755 RepID=A0A0F9AD56_9ZZZZ